MKTLIYVSGGKGGIGKSMQSVALVDYLLTFGDVLLLDADPVNPDSSAAFKNGKQPAVTCERVRIRSEDATGLIDASGLMSALDKTNETTAKYILIDAPAGDSTLLAEAGVIVVDACKEINAKSVFVWMIDSADRTGINALAAAWDNIKDADSILLVKNNKTGNNFDSFDGSKTIEKILQNKNVQVIDMPKIAARLLPLLRVERKSFFEISTEGALGNRMEATRLRKQMHEIFKGAGL
jgi:hypothetical protein